jgi:hypothetical protein
MITFGSRFLDVESSLWRVGRRRLFLKWADLSSGVAIMLLKPVDFVESEVHYR